jgi:tRNA-splicing ligase RtcB (3'-phosphate/5'-hydroxy nucleic acid ligase)
MSQTRKPDRYEARARELALAAGVDPDNRIERPGQRSMPAGCAYRDAARAQQVAAETAAVAHELPPQRPEYRDAPLKVVGEHDEGTVGQMRNCMGVGNVVAGVICADGHLGYAQPVGGVIAYEKQISISGVGFDIGCGNMAVRLDTPFSAIEDKVGAIIKDIARVISFGVGRSNEERVEHELFDDTEAWASSDIDAYRQKAGAQLGTVGSGNHYVDLMRDTVSNLLQGDKVGCLSLSSIAVEIHRVIADGAGFRGVLPLMRSFCGDCDHVALGQMVTHPALDTGPARLAWGGHLRVDHLAASDELRFAIHDNEHMVGVSNVRLKLE